jgi:hypothetical protein
VRRRVVRLRDEHLRLAPLVQGLEHVADLGPVF